MVGRMRRSFGEEMTAGTYELIFFVGDHFGERRFLDRVPVRFVISDAGRNITCRCWFRRVLQHVSRKLMKLQAPTSSSREAPNTKHQKWFVARSLLFGAWNFSELGACCLELMSASDARASAPAGLVDLAAERVGGKALVANDEFFAEKENLLKPGRGVFIADKYTTAANGWTVGKRAAPNPRSRLVRRAARIARDHQAGRHRYEPFPRNHPPFASLDAVCLANGLPNEIDALPGHRSLRKFL